MKAKDLRTQEKRKYEYKFTELLRDGKFEEVDISGNDIDSETWESSIIEMISLDGGLVAVRFKAVEHLEYGSDYYVIYKGHLIINHS